MITFEKFKELFICLDSSRHPEIEIYFGNNIYMLIKFDNYITYGKCNAICVDDIFKFDNLDELYNTKVGDFCLKEDWNKIDDILIDLTFSVVNDKDELNKIYHIDL